MVPSSVKYWMAETRRQNEALRAVTGCTRMSGIDHLRHEARCIPADSHCKLLAAQFATRAKRQGRPVNLFLHRKHDRNMKISIVQHLSSCRETFDIPDTVKGKQLSDELHTTQVMFLAVSRTITSTS